MSRNILELLDGESIILSISDSNCWKWNLKNLKNYLRGKRQVIFEKSVLNLMADCPKELWNPEDNKVTSLMW